MKQVVFNRSPYRSKLMFFGDPHGDFAPVLRAIKIHRSEGVILLGDLQAQRPLDIYLARVPAETQVWFILGNHDTDSAADYDHIFECPLADRCLHGQVVSIGGLKVAGLGGVFRGSVWAPEDGHSVPRFRTAAAMIAQMKPHERWRGGLSLRHRSTIFPCDYEALAERRAHVLVTHEGPGMHRHGRRAIDVLANKLGVDVLVHGHLHANIDYQAIPELDSSSRRWLAFDVDKGSFITWPLPAADRLPSGSDA